METIKRLVVSDRDRVREMSGQGPKDFQGSENTLCDIIVMNTCHYTFA